ncbi:hypothetical protein EVAR_99949_1 [Eumeta japonica]|uniref:Uncharacterized protein n=1 Tax=Eumeta variegata TaxID=151549 RepID=A0A4C1ZM68_EUMVA|nr:hypothetical protein EVAR_99949_1 [Eumeta japonica]
MGCGRVPPPTPPRPGCAARPARHLGIRLCGRPTLIRSFTKRTKAFMRNTSDEIEPSLCPGLTWLKELPSFFHCLVGGPPTVATCGSTCKSRYYEGLNAPYTRAIPNAPRRKPHHPYISHRSPIGEGARAVGSPNPEIRDARENSRRWRSTAGTRVSSRVDGGKRGAPNGRAALRADYPATARCVRSVTNAVYDWQNAFVNVKRFTRHRYDVNIASTEGARARPFAT